MRALIVAIHGILTGQTNPNWTDQLDAWVFDREPGWKVLKKEYFAGPWPRWNCLVRDPFLAEGLAREIALFNPSAASAPSDVPPEPRPVWIVAHSNGAVIALMTTRRLVARGRRVAGLILLGAACPADLRRNGVLAWLDRGQLGCAIAFCCAEDVLLGGSANPERSRAGRWSRWCWHKLIWPYGTLGSTGWLLAGRGVGTQFRVSQGVLSGAGAGRSAALSVYWFTGGHSAYFTPGNQPATFALIHQLALARPAHRSNSTL